MFNLYRALRKLCLDFLLVPDGMIDWARAPAPQTKVLAHAPLPGSAHANINTVGTDETRDIDETGDVDKSTSPIASSSINLQDKQVQAPEDGVKFDKVVELVQVMPAYSARCYMLLCTLQRALLQQVSAVLPCQLCLMAMNHSLVCEACAAP